MILTPNKKFKLNTTVVSVSSLKFHIYTHYCLFIFALYPRHQRHFTIAEVLSHSPSYSITYAIFHTRK
jgi:hypothetical protein